MVKTPITENEERIPLWKRLLSYSIDFICFFGVFIVFFMTLGKMIVTKISSENVKEINECYQLLVDNINKELFQGYELVDSNDNYGIKSLNEQVFIDFEKGKYPDKSDDDIYEDYEKAIQNLDSEVSNSPKYNSNQKILARNYYLILLLFLFVPSFVFTLLIPLLNHSQSTLGMMVFKLGLCKRRDGTLPNKFILLARFMIELLSSFILFYLIGYIAIPVLLLFSIVIILITKSRLSLTDALTGTKVNNKEAINKIENI